MQQSTAPTNIFLTLDRLEQQVESGQCRVAIACSRLDNLINSLCHDEVTRPFLTFLERILTLVLGNEEKAGWVEWASDEESSQALWELLKPSGSLFSAALSHSSFEASNIFEVSPSNFPVTPPSHFPVLLRL